MRARACTVRRRVQARIFVDEGVVKIRLTGGEPTVRRDVVDVAAALGSLRGHGLETLAMTTNGLVLGRHLASLSRAGLTALNISLDTLQADRFEELTRRPGLPRVLDVIHAAIDFGFTVKINVVPVRGVNDDELPAFVRLTRDLPVNVRFIEYMPFDGNAWSHRRMVRLLRVTRDSAVPRPGLRTAPACSDARLGRRMQGEQHHGGLHSRPVAAAPRTAVAHSHSDACWASWAPFITLVSLTVFPDVTREPPPAPEWVPLKRLNWRNAQYTYQEMKADVEREFGALQRCADPRGEVAKNYVVPGHAGSVSFVSSMTEHFCSDCNRIRLMADGNLKVCLFGSSEVSLRDAMREGATDNELRCIIGAAVRRKKKAHADVNVLAATKNRAMIQIGG